VATAVLNRTVGPDAAAAPGASRARSRVRAQWLLLGAACTVLAGALVAWSLSRAADRVAVVSMARPVAAGTTLVLEDFATTAIGLDGTATGLVPSASLERLVGRVATIDLQVGTLLTAGMWSDGVAVSDGERVVGAVLAPGHVPAGLAQGSSAIAVASEGPADDPGVMVRVLDVTRSDDGDLLLTLAVGEAGATQVARLAATDLLVLVGLP
jgi:hypothetical protein